MRLLPSSLTLAGLLIARTAAAELPPKTRVDLVVPRANADHSAYRLDVEVFGWNRDFTEVACVGSEIARGPNGGHRGEVNLLAYEVGKIVPLHVVIAHNVTHADLPNEPVPIEDARDLMWAIEDSFQGMWPKRPKHRAPAGAMRVEPISEPNPRGGGLCTPEVGFILTYRGQRRFQPFQALDMTVRCAHLGQTDTRIYWGNQEVAAAMMRYDFSARKHNEQSARFAISAAWRLARPLHAEMAFQTSASAGVQSGARRLLQRFASVSSSGTTSTTSAGRGRVVSVAVKPELTALGRHLLRFWQGAQLLRLSPEDSQDVRVVIGTSVPPAPPPEAAPKDGPPVATVGAAPSTDVDAPFGDAAPAADRPARPNQSSATVPPQVAGGPVSPVRPPSRYLDGWKLP